MVNSKLKVSKIYDEEIVKNKKFAKKESKRLAGCGKTLVIDKGTVTIKDGPSPIKDPARKVPGRVHVKRLHAQKEKASIVKDTNNEMPTGLLATDHKEDGGNSMSPAGPVELSRNALMLKAKDLGIKNFRILNKSELAEAVDISKGGSNPMDSDRIKAIVAGAVARWKSGWKKNKAGAK